ncbi:MAG: cyclase family protein [Acidobacteriota bacterium]|nr:cyclase family protein [Acidobacteriota bacterium]
MTKSVVDLTHVIQTGMPVYPGTPPVRVAPLAVLDKDGFRETSLVFSSHCGTHVDAPAHMLPGGRRLDDFAPETFMGTARCLHVDEAVVSAAWLQSRLAAKPNVDFLLFFTGWDRYWGRKEYFQGYPAIDAAAAARLAEYGLKGIGLDCPSPDAPEAVGYPAHQALFAADLLIIENLRGLDRLPESIFQLALFPLLHAGGDGAPARVIALQALNKE